MCLFLKYMWVIYGSMKSSVFIYCMFEWIVTLSDVWGRRVFVYGPSNRPFKPENTGPKSEKTMKDSTANSERTIDDSTGSRLKQGDTDQVFSASWAQAVTLHSHRDCAWRWNGICLRSCPSTHPLLYLTSPLHPGRPVTHLYPPLFSLRCSALPFWTWSLCIVDVWCNNTKWQHLLPSPEENHR